MDDHAIIMSHEATGRPRQTELRDAGRGLSSRSLALLLLPTASHLSSSLEVPGIPRLRRRQLGAPAYFHLNNRRDAAPLRDELAAVIDHVQTHSNDGPDTPDNFVTACNRCNMQKSNRDVGPFVDQHPRHMVKARYGEPTDWDGMTAVFIKLAGPFEGRLTAAERGWLKALTTERDGA
jgi:hypothetical protein